ncbi:MAG: class I SAM-dependent methyltransferase [Anderseniella sp.]|nr:class I SAM-dependent methyltransferase [Anderseniella sp.]
MKDTIPQGIKNKLKKSQWIQDNFASGNSIAPFKFHGSHDDVRKDIETRYQFSGDLLDIYVAGSGELVHKWHHYLPIYERYFSQWRGKPVRFLEIGVSKGGSLAMWRKYLGDNAIIYGIDIDERCREYDGLAGTVRIGSQDDPNFLKTVVEEMGGIDIVLDDGSHVMKHIEASIEVLMPLLASNGVYVIEDLHTAYWRGYGGGFGQKANFFNYVRDVIDDIHQWYHVSPIKHPNVSPHCNTVHIYDSICVFEKFPVQRPVHSQVQLRQGDRS